jgi:hypothetical protein
MNRVGNVFAAIAIVFMGIAVFAPSPGASSEHFVIVNNNDGHRFSESARNDYATVLRLEGTKQNPLVAQAALLNSGEPSAVQIFANAPTVQIVRIGSGVCVFMADSAGTEAINPNEITSFRYPSMKPVGSFSDSNVANPELGILIAARGNYLFAAYDGYGTSNHLATWQMNPDCTLTLLGTYQTTNPDNAVSNMAVTPDGKTIVVSEGGDEFCCADSFSVGAGGVLTEHGPYPMANALGGGGVDITADSAFAIFAAQTICNPTCYNQINVFPINSDGSLGTQTVFGGDGSLGPDSGGGSPWLSPNEKFLFETGTGLTTLNFSENPLNVTYTGCHTVLKPPDGNPYLFPVTIATVATSGAGGGIYVAENDEVSAVALLTIDSTTGCTTEEHNSPTILSDKNADVYSLVAWPSRLF